MYEPKIKIVEAFETPDGKVHKTINDAKLGIAGLIAKLRHVEKEITRLSKEQRKRKDSIKHFIVVGAKHGNVSHYRKQLQSEIAINSRNITSHFWRREALVNQLNRK